MTDQTYKILIFGPQGSGKGTQAEMLSQALGIPHISPGAMYRQIQQENSEFSRLVADYLNQGELMPDHYTNQLVQKRLASPDCARGFILDGYPRNRAQADALNAHTAIDYIIELQLPDEIGVERIAGRRVCPNGHTYHLTYSPPQRKGGCDQDGLPLKQREDETEEGIQQRLAIYHTETEPLIELYRSRGVPVIEVDGRPTIEEVGNIIRKNFLHDHP